MLANWKDNRGILEVRWACCNLRAYERTRNGNTGELLGEKYQDATTKGPPTQRIERYKLQNALLDEVPHGLIQLSKRLAKIEESSEGSTLFFQDGTSAGKFDLVVGADGIKSVCC
jgi:salicylate hydroxylase